MKKNLAEKVSDNEKSRTFAPAKSKDDSVAQQVEHNTFNVGVLGSSPSRVTTKAVNCIVVRQNRTHSKCIDQEVM